MIRKMHLGVTLVAAAALASVAAFAGTAMAGGVGGGDRVALVGGPFGGDGGFGAATFLPGLGGANASSTLLRFVNAGSAAGTVTLTLYDAGTGAQVATYTSASIPSAAGLQVTLSQVISGATPTLGTADQTRVYNVAATATFRGTVAVAAFIQRTTGAASNQWLPPLPAGSADPGTAPNMGTFAGLQHVLVTLAKPGDVNGDDAVDGSDLGTLLGKWGPVAPGDAAAQACDLNRDGQVDGADLGIVLSNWG